MQIEKEALKRKILVYQDKTHIPRVVKKILFNWEEQSQSRWFNAILTVAYKERVIAYYKEFKKQLEGQADKLNIAMTFSFGNENDTEDISPEIVGDMFKGYAEFTGIEFTSGDRRRGEDAYFEDIVSRGTRGGRSSKVIVEHYATAVEKFYLKAEEMIRTLSKPRDWEELKSNDEGKQLFILTFRDANDQLGLVMQYMSLIGMLILLV